jgi:hypothetical protein
MQYLLEYSDWANNREQELNEDWGWDDLVHLGVDVVSAVADTVVPGSGSVIDIIHAISYSIQSSFAKTEAEKVSLNMQGLITLASVAAISGAQALAVALKAQIKIVMTAFTEGLSNPSALKLAKAAAPEVSAKIKTLLGMVESIGKWVGQKIREFKNSELGEWVVSKFGSIDIAITKIGNLITQGIPASINKFLQFLAKLNPLKLGAHGATGETSELVLKTAAKHFATAKAANTTIAAITNTTTQTNKEVATLTKKPQAKPNA